MAKDKRKKKYFQGYMTAQRPQSKEFSGIAETTRESSDSSFSCVKPDLLRLLIIGGLCLVILGVLTYIDKSSNLLGNIAEKALSNIIR